MACAVTVLDFTLQLVETGAEDNMLSALLVFSLQYVLVNHEHWKYKLKHARWQVTLKVPFSFTSCFSSVCTPKYSMVLFSIWVFCIWV